MDPPGEQELIRRHLTYDPGLDPQVRIYSTFTGALRDARQATGRDLATGKVVQDIEGGYWLGTIGYMVLLDQIGTCFRPRGQRATDGRSFVKALELFTYLGREERLALYALRCCFAHDFSVFNGESRSALTHAFRLADSGASLVVQLPQPPWSGDISTVQPDQITHVDLRLFGDLVEQIVDALLDLNETGELEVALANGASGLTRYQLIARR